MRRGWRTTINMQEMLSPNPTLKTERLVLRPLTLADVDLIWPDISDPEISRQMAWEAHTERSQTVEFLEHEVARLNSGKGITWAVFKDGAFCGIFSLIGLVRKHRALTYDKAELAYWISRKYQRQGIMTEAGRRVVQFAFEELKLHKLVVSHFSENAASENLIKRLGFRYVGEQIEEFQKRGVWHNHKLYELLESEFHAANQSA